MFVASAWPAAATSFTLVALERALRYVMLALSMSLCEYACVTRKVAQHVSSPDAIQLRELVDASGLSLNYAETASLYRGSIRFVVLALLFQRHRCFHMQPIK